MKLRALADGLEVHVEPGRAGLSPEQVRAKLEALSAAHGGISEFAVITHCHDAAARQRSYTLLAEAFGMKGTVTPALAAE